MRLCMAALPLPSCAIGFMTSTGSSTALSSTGCSRRSLASAMRSDRYCSSWWPAPVQIHRVGWSPPSPWLQWRSSAPPGDAFRPRWTGASTDGATTRSRRSRRSAPDSGNRWTWTHCRSNCLPSWIRRCSRREPRSGCDHRLRLPCWRAAKDRPGACETAEHGRLQGLALPMTVREGEARSPVTVLSLPGRRAAGGRPQSRP
jgi:hypothetical protein